MGNLTLRRPSRGGSGALGEWARPLGHGTLVAGCGVIALLAMQNSYLLPTLVLAIVFSIVVVGLDVQLGYARQLVFSQPVFMAVGAYSTGYLTSVRQMGTVPAFLIGLGISLVLAVVVALAVSRARGIALTIVTVFLVLILTNILSVTKSLGGTDGLAGIPAAAIGGHEISTPLQFGWLALVVLVLCVGVASRFVHSGTGVEVALAAESEEAARAFGVHVARRRLLVFVFAAACADIAGSLYAQSQGFVSPDGFNITLAMNLLLMLYLGGKRSVIGGIAGSVILTFLPVVFSGIADYFLLVEGAAFVLVLLVAPDGIVGLVSTGVRSADRPVGRTVRPGASLRGRDRRGGDDARPRRRHGGHRRSCARPDQALQRHHRRQRVVPGGAGDRHHRRDRPERRRQVHVLRPHRGSAAQ
ncbi:branched-chain amino acid ABC transporter permease [Streptosporangium lutulentum]